MVNINIEEYLLDIAKNIDVFDMVIQNRILIELLNAYKEYQETFIRYNSGELHFPGVTVNNMVYVELTVRWSRLERSCNTSMSTINTWL